MNLSTLKNHKNNTNDCLEKLFFFILMPGFFWSLAGWMYVTIPDRYRTEVDFRARAVRTDGIVTKKNQQTTCYGGGLGCSSSCDVTVKFQTNRGKLLCFPTVARLRMKIKQFQYCMTQTLPPSKLGLI